MSGIPGLGGGLALDNQQTAFAEATQHVVFGDISFGPVSFNTTPPRTFNSVTPLSSLVAADNLPFIALAFVGAVLVWRLAK